VDTRLTQGQLDAQYRDMLDDSFDINAINQYVIGRTWEQATPEQKQEYLKLFKEFVIRTYGSPLRFHPGDGLRVGDINPQNEKDTDVSTEITHPDGAAPTPVDWIVRRKDGGKLVIVDVIVNGVSLNAMQRDQFAAILASNGGDFSGLLNTLHHKVR
jgi:phospholipid transport system substrate-binding protein